MLTRLLLLISMTLVWRASRREIALQRQQKRRQRQQIEMAHHVSDGDKPERLGLAFRKSGDPLHRGGVLIWRAGLNGRRAEHPRQPPVCRENRCWQAKRGSTGGAVSPPRTLR